MMKKCCRIVKLRKTRQCKTSLAPYARYKQNVCRFFLILELCQFQFPHSAPTPAPDNGQRLPFIHKPRTQMPGNVEWCGNAKICIRTSATVSSEEVRESARDNLKESIRFLFTKYYYGDRI